MTKGGKKGDKRAAWNVPGAPEGNSELLSSTSFIRRGVKGLGEDSCQTMI